MPQSTGQGEEVRGQGRFDPNFFDPRPRRRRDSNDNHERDNERRQNRQRVDDNTNNVSVHDSGIEDLYPHPIFANNYSAFSFNNKFTSALEPVE